MAAGDHLAALDDGQPWTNREALALLGALSFTLRLEDALPRPATSEPPPSRSDDMPDHLAALLGLIAIGRAVRRLLPAPGPPIPARPVPENLGDILR